MSRKSNQHGFTIVELMIATAVLATILVIVTAIMISISNLYYKGITQAREQDDTRSIIDDVSKQVELSDTPVSTNTFSYSDATFGSLTVKEYCVGTVRYSYVLNKQVGTQAPHVLVRDTIADGSCPNAPTPLGSASGATDLIAPGSMLTYFHISNTSPYTIKVSTAYGDSTSSTLLNLTGYTTTCKGDVGDQFCATAALTTAVVQRL